MKRQAAVESVNLRENRDLSIKQIVPRVADEGDYMASESPMYRILRDARQSTHRAAARPQRSRRPRELTATAPNQVWSWDIAYLQSRVRGVFHYLYVVMDVFSRKIVGWAVHSKECTRHATELIERACAIEDIGPDQLVIHSDNGSPMKGATLIATLQELGVATSFSRPRVSDDNPYSEALFRTVKYRPEYPSRPFETLEAARDWVSWFVGWHNDEHRHSAIRFVTPAQGHTGLDVEILAKRDEVYTRSRDAKPERWSGKTRDWSHIDVVRLNAEPQQAATEAAWWFRRQQP